MKKILSTFMVSFGILLAFSACSSPSTSSEEATAAAPSQEELSSEAQFTQNGIDLSSEYQYNSILFANESQPSVYRQMVALADANLLNSNWSISDPSSYTPDQIIQYALYSQEDKLSYWGTDSYSVPADIIESSAQSSFGIGADFLHTSPLYQADTNSYVIMDSSAHYPLFMVNSPDYSRGYALVLWMEPTEGVQDSYHIVGETYLSISANDVQSEITFLSGSYQEYKEDSSSDLLESMNEDEPIVSIDETIEPPVSEEVSAE